MKKQKLMMISIVLILLVFLGMFLADQATLTPEEYYIEYLNTAKKNRLTSFENYLHYENSQAYELALTSTSINQLYSYEILSSKQLSDKLWAFTARLVTDFMPDGGVVTNFVGVIDGEFRVMLSNQQIPAALQGSLDLSEYDVPEALDFSDIIR